MQVGVLPAAVRVGQALAQGPFQGVAAGLGDPARTGVVHRVLKDDAPQPEVDEAVGGDALGDPPAQPVPPERPEQPVADLGGAVVQVDVVERHASGDGVSGSRMVHSTRSGDARDRAHSSTPARSFAGPRELQRWISASPTSPA